jgi:hypothetical protein
VKFAFGFLVGLMTGVTITLGPIIAVFVAMVGFEDPDENKNETTITYNAVKENPENRREGTS